MAFSYGFSDADYLQRARSTPAIVDAFRFHITAAENLRSVYDRLGNCNIMDNEAIIETFRAELLEWMKNPPRAPGPQVAPVPALPVLPASTPIPTLHPFGTQGQTLYQALQARPAPIQAFNMLDRLPLDTRNVNNQRVGRFSPSRRSVSNTAAQRTQNYQHSRAQRVPSHGSHQSATHPGRFKVIAVVLPIRFTSLNGNESEATDDFIKYRFIATDFSALYDHLRDAGLTVPIEIPEDGIIDHLDILQPVTTELVKAGFRIPGYPNFQTPEDVQFTSATGFYQMWFKIVRTMKNGHSEYSTVKNAGVVPQSLQFKNIKAFLIENTDEIPRDRSPLPPFLLLAPHEGNLRRALTGMSGTTRFPRRDEPHSCYGYHLLQPLQIFATPELKPDAEISCENSCPRTASAQDNRSAPRQLTPPPSTIGRTRPHPSPQATRVVRAQTESIAETDIPAPTSMPEPPSPTPAPRAIIAPRVNQGNALEQGLIEWPDVDQSKKMIPLVDDFASLVDQIQSKIKPSEANTITVSSNEDMMVVIRTVLEFYVENGSLEGYRFPPGTSVRQRPFLIQQLFNIDTEFLILRDEGRTTRITSGSSPILDVLTRMLVDVTNEAVEWIDGPHDSNYKIPNFEPVEGILRPNYFQPLEVAGVLTGFYIGRHGLAPLPISPFFIAAIASEDPSTILSLPHSDYALLEPSVFTKMADILCWDINDERPREIGHPICQFILSVFGYLPSAVPNRFGDKDEYDRFMARCWRKVLFDNVNAFEHPAFLAFRKGFQLSVDSSTANPNFSVAQMIGEGGRLRENMVYMYNQIPDDIKQVLPKVKCVPHSRTTKDLLYTALFELRVRQYLLRSGHPEAMRETVGISREQFEKAKADPSFRWRLLVTAFTGTPQMSPIPEWDIRFKIYAATEANYKESEANPCAIHACFGNADVYLTREIKKLLLKVKPYVEEDEFDGTFDNWLHSQLWSLASGSPFFNGS
ncbi:hypothetical protein DL96DRAFT_1773980 [Flagelloscypha sp. PMI_526]|nr:hypothetical protein DL96DRAFT_1773980 [Flagelloscypha sp. PMI_526]